MWYLAGILEGVEVLRQRQRGNNRSLVNSAADRDPASVRPSYTGLWLEMIGVGLSTGNAARMPIRPTRQPSHSPPPVNTATMR
jgi:hypothetical protein